MTVYVGSRYAAGFLVTTEDEEGAVTDFVFRFPGTSSGSTYSYKTVVQGDRLDTIASDIYGDPLQWWRIADANPSLDDVLTLIPGTRLVVPNVT